MRAFDVRWIRLAIAAGAIVGSALVSSVAVATDEAPSTEPPPTTPSDVASIAADPVSADVIVVDPPPAAPFEDVAVIEIVMPEPESIEPEAIEPAIVEPALDSSPSVDESPSRCRRNQPTSRRKHPTQVPSRRKNPVENTRAAPAVKAIPTGSPSRSPGSTQTASRSPLSMSWSPPEVLAQFELSAASQTGQGKTTSATCTYPDGGGAPCSSTIRAMALAPTVSSSPPVRRRPTRSPWTGRWTAGRSPAPTARPTRHVTSAHVAVRAAAATK